MRTKEEIDLDVASTQELAKKIFEIISILDNDPQRVIGALAIALGNSSAIYNCDIDRSIKIVRVYNEKMKKMFEEFKEFSDSELSVAPNVTSSKENLN